MTHLNKTMTATALVLAAIIITTTTVASFVITSNIATPAAATTTASNATTTTTSSPSSRVELSAQPIYQEQEKLESQIPINQTHFQVVVS